MSDQIEDGLVRETRERIIREGAFPEISHLVLMGVVVVLALPSVPHRLLAAWGLVIAAACAMRAYRRRRLITRDYTSHERRLTRATTTTLALAWGVGAGLFSRWLPFADLALMFMIVTGLVAGATSTFAADRRAFRYFLAGILVPLALGVLLDGPVTHSHVIALILTGVFSVVMSVAHQRGYASLTQQALTNVELTASEERAAQERARLNALFASAPVATVVVDEDGRVRDANPRFRVAVRLHGGGGEGALAERPHRAAAGAQPRQAARRDGAGRRAGGDRGPAAAQGRGAGVGARLRGPGRGGRVGPVRPVRGHLGGDRGAGGAPGGEGGGGARGADAQRLPRQHEPRDPHPDERGAGPGGAAPRQRAQPASSGARST